MAIFVFRGTWGESYLCLLHNKLKVKLCGCVGSLNPIWAVKHWFQGVLNANSALFSAHCGTQCFIPSGISRIGTDLAMGMCFVLLHGKSLAAPAVSRWITMADTPDQDWVTCSQGSAHCSGATKSTESGESRKMNSYGGKVAKKTFVTLIWPNQCMLLFLTLLSSCSVFLLPLLCVCLSLAVSPMPWTLWSLLRSKCWCCVVHLYSEPSFCHEHHSHAFPSPRSSLYTSREQN